MIAVAAAYVSILVLALYIDSDSVRILYREPLLLWAVCPVLLYWTTRIVFVAERGRMDDDPIVFAFRDRASYLCAILILRVNLGCHPFVTNGKASEHFRSRPNPF